MTINWPVKNFGGMLPYPPDNCEKKEFWKTCQDGVTWVDLSACHSCSIIKECDTRAIYLKAVKNGEMP